MKKLFITLPLLIVGYLSMTLFVAHMAEKEITTILSENNSSDFSVDLISYQRGFFSSTVVSEMHIEPNQSASASFKITTTINHYPHQAILNNRIEMLDAEMAKKAESYFGKTHWITSTEKIDLFSQLTGQLTIAGGKYENESETLSSEPFVLDYQVDLETKNTDFILKWAGLTATTHDTIINLNSLQLASHVGELTSQSDYDYQLKIKYIEVQQTNSHSVLEGLVLNGKNKKGAIPETIDTTNELIVDSYQIKAGTSNTFTDNRLKLTLKGLYQPAFELLNTGSDDTQKIEDALVQLVNHGAQLSLSQLKSQTPWGEVDGTLDLVLDKGASLVDIIVNPYILFDYMSGDANLVLPLSLLEESSVSEPLQMGIMTGFLEQKEQTLSLKTSFQQGELIVNDRVIPL